MATVAPVTGFTVLALPAARTMSVAAPARIVGWRWAGGVEGLSNQVSPPSRLRHTPAWPGAPVKAMYTITPPSGAGFGSTRTLYPVAPANRWSRPGSDTFPAVPGGAFCSVLRLSVLSSTVHVRPPSIDRSSPTPAEVYAP